VPAEAAACAAARSLASAQPLDGALAAWLDISHVHADVDRGDTVGQVADGDYVDAGLGDGNDGVFVDAAGRLDHGAPVH